MIINQQISSIHNLSIISTAPDPEYGFKKKLELKKHGQTKKQVKLKCKVDNPEARVKWYKDGVPVSKSDPNILIENDEGVQTLTIREARLEDAGKYTCKIEEFAKEGEGETSCDVTIGGIVVHFIYYLLLYTFNLFS